MTAVYISFYHPSNARPSLPTGLRAKGFAIECLKGKGPDDGEANLRVGKYRIECPEAGWQAVIRWLEETGQSLMYSVVASGAEGKADVVAAGELNAAVAHYTTRLFNHRQLFEHWFEESLPTSLAA